MNKESAVSAMVRHSASGAAGVHSDQKTKRLQPAGKTNRVNTRSAAKSAAIKDSY